MRSWCVSLLLLVTTVGPAGVRAWVPPLSLRRSRTSTARRSTTPPDDATTGSSDVQPPPPPQPPTPFAQEQPPVLNEVRRKRMAQGNAAAGKPPTAVEDLVTNLPASPRAKGAAKPPSDEDKLLFPELGQAGIDEKALRASPLGKILFSVLDRLFPVFKEPNWFDVYDPPLTSEENLKLPYFDGFDFVNSSWTFYVRHRYGWWNWLDRLGLVPPVTYRCFIRGDGVTMWSDGFYGDWYINPAINYIQIEKHHGRGYGYTQYSRGIRIFQVQKWNFEHEVGRYWNRGLRSYLRNETNYWAIEGRIWGTAVKWRPYPRDQGKFIAIRDGTNLTAVFGSEDNTPWERRFRHSMSLPFYQAHPDQLERIEDNFDVFYKNLLGEKVR